MHAWSKIVPEDTRENYMHILLRKQAYPSIVQENRNKSNANFGIDPLRFM